MRNYMNIALATDNNFVHPCAVCITSVLENHKEIECHIYVLTEGLNKDNENIFLRLASIYNQKIEIVNVNPASIKNIKANDRFPIANYYRLLLPEILDVDRVLYLDGDIIVRKNILEFYNENLEGLACAVVEDHRDDDIRFQNRNGVYGKFCNAGVLVINLDFWREHNVSQQLIDFIIDNTGKLLFPDQDALNYVERDYLKFCSYTYNYQVEWYLPFEEMYMHKSKWDEIAKYREDPAIIHYNESLKPWHLGCTHPSRSCFFDYANRIDFLKMRDPNDHPKYSLKYRIVQRLLNFLIKLDSSMSKI